jgi:hypothetical protein
MRSVSRFPPHGPFRGLLVLGVAALILVSTAASGSAEPSSPPHVTVIGDSVLTAVYWNSDPLQVLTSGLDVDMEIAVCRRLVGVSCPFEGERPTTLVDLVDTLGPSLGSTVVVEAGYNEPEADFAAGVEESLAALRAAGVERVLWVSLSERRADFARMNVTLAAAARKHPELTIVDWARLTHANDDWFQGDGIHLTYTGAFAMARLLRAALDQALAETGETGTLASTASVTVSTAALPPARVGRPYEAHLLANGGFMLPYRWSVASGALPRGLHMTPSGRLYGVVLRPLDTRITFRVQAGAARPGARTLRLVATT